jgi:hypothetical protein
MDLLRTILIIRYIPIILVGALAVGMTLLIMGSLAGIFVLQGVQRVTHGQNFFPPEPPRKPQPKPTGLSIFMQNALTSQAGRNAARRHLLIPDPAFARGASSLRSERVQRGIGHPLAGEPLGNSPVPSGNHSRVSSLAPSGVQVEPEVSK